MQGNVGKSQRTTKKDSGAKRKDAANRVHQHQKRGNASKKKKNRHNFGLIWTWLRESWGKKKKNRLGWGISANDKTNE